MTGVRQTQATQVFVIPECPSPRKAHPHHDPNEESPESQWLFGAGLGARSPQRTPRGKRRKADMVTQKRTLPRRRLRSPRPFVLRRDRHKETRKPEVNPQSPITAPSIRERANGDPDPRRNRNGTSRKPSCLAHRRQTAGVIEHRTFRQERMTGAERTQDIWIEPHARHFDRNA